MFFPDLDALQNGNEDEWRTAFVCLWPVAVAAARRRLHRLDPDAVEDVASDAIRQVAEEVRDGALRSEIELRALTAVIARRAAVSHLRKRLAQRRAADRTESIENHQSLPCAAQNPFDEVDAMDLARLLGELVRSQLASRQRTLVEAFYFEGLTHAEIAARFGIPIGSVGVELKRSRTALQNFLRTHPSLLKELSETLR